MVDTKALLKGFGAGADVFGQIATDKAINSRRRTSSTFDISDGVLMEDIALGPDNPATVKHTLGRVPVGALVLKHDATTGDVDCVGTSLETILIRQTGGVTATLWVV